MSSKARNLGDILDGLDGLAGGGPRVTMGEVMECVGERSFGPLLVLPGIAALTPLGLVPALPTAIALVVILIAGQLAIGRKSFWLPRFLLERSVKSDRFHKSMRVARKPATWVDRLVRPGRFDVVAGRRASRGVALACCVTALAIPPLELVPFGVGAPAAAITAFGLGLTSRDGLFVIAGLLASAATVTLVLWALFFR
ncbi:MAG TPA: exopolysaccharide biosynthesis protein [Caulobacteraceae bacterium]|nr:exopolysaccharide biosynthesis protein [Caulobacteraceae bacterium]